MSHGFYLSLVFTFLFLLQSLNNDEDKFKSTLSTCSTLGRNLTLGNSVFIAKYQELDFLLHPNFFYHRSIECLTNNRTNPLEYKPLLCGYNWNFASIQSANEYSLRRKLKRSKCKVNYYPNSCATFHLVLQGDLVFKLNPGPPNNGKSSSLRSHSLVRCPLSTQSKNPSHSNGYVNRPSHNNNGIPVVISNRINHTCHPSRPRICSKQRVLSINITINTSDCPRSRVPEILHQQTRTLTEIANK